MMFLFKKSLHLFGLPVYAAWLLLICGFEDTKDWTEEKMLFLRRSFAVVMLLMMGTTVFFSLRALPNDIYFEKRVDRIEARLDYQVEKAVGEHREIYQRLERVEANTAHMDRLIYGVIGLTVAVLGQWMLQLFKLKIERERQ